MELKLKDFKSDSPKANSLSEKRSRIGLLFHAGDRWQSQNSSTTVILVSVVIPSIEQLVIFLLRLQFRPDPTQGSYCSFTEWIGLLALFSS
jgi:hypothetical protein